LQLGLEIDAALGDPLVDLLRADRPVFPQVGSDDFVSRHLGSGLIHFRSIMGDNGLQDPAKGENEPLPPRALKRRRHSKTGSPQGLTGGLPASPVGPA
jgi:hypothetical protein